MFKYNILLFLTIIHLYSFLSATTLHVPVQVKTIQEAINRSADGDTVLVAPGIYKENINFQGKNIMVTSHFLLSPGPEFINNTIIDGSNPANPDIASCVVFLSGEGPTAILQGFTLTKGTGTIRNEANGTSWREGGGIMIVRSSPTIQHNLIINNTVLDITSVTSTGGGGISCTEGNPQIFNNTITLNQARYAAGIMLYRSGVDLKNNLICQNRGGQDYGGGAIVMESNGPADKIMENNAIIANTSWGNGFYGGRAGALLIFKTSLLAHNNRNNIIWGNIQNNGEQIYIHPERTIVELNHNNIEGGYPGEGNINKIPAFSKILHPGTPYSGIPWPIPGNIEAETFDWGPEGIAYHDNDEKNQGRMFRLSGVDLEKCNDWGRGYYVSHMQKGEWLNYTVDIAASTTYDLNIRMGSPTPQSRFHIECDEKDLTGSIQVRVTHGTKNEHSFTVPNLQLPAGQHVIRFVCENQGFDIDAFYFSLASSTLPPQWQNQDIGTVSITGNAGFLNGVFHIQGAGTVKNPDNDPDQFHFAFQKWSGNIEIIAHLRTQTYTNDWARTGLMIRESTDDNSKFAFIAVTPTISPVLYHRKEKGGLVDYHNWRNRSDYNWLKLTRIGDTFTSYQSQDGKTWKALGQWAGEGIAQIPMTAPIYVGLAIESKKEGFPCTATFDHVQVKQL